MRCASLRPLRSPPNPATHTDRFLFCEVHGPAQTFVHPREFLSLYIPNGCSSAYFQKCKLTSFRCLG